MRFTDDEALCEHFTAVPIAERSMQFGWARVNTTPTGEEVLAVGLATGLLHSEQEAAERRVQQFLRCTPRSE